MNTNSAFTGSYSENPLWFQQTDRRQTRILRGGQPIVDFDTADKCRLCVTTIKAMNFHDGINSIPFEIFSDHYVLMFGLISMQDASKKFRYPELIGEPLSLELNFAFPLKHVFELFVLGERMFSVAVDKCGVVGKKSKMDNFSLQQIINRI